MLNEKKGDILENIGETMEDILPEKVAFWTANHLKRTAIAVLMLFIVVVAALLFLSHNRQNTLRQQMEQQAAQIERQNQLIEAYAKKAAETPQKPKPFISSETLKSQINSLQELVTQEYIYTNADQRTDNVKWLFGWKRPFSDSRLLVTYDGSIKAGIDLKEVQVALLKEENEKNGTDR